MLDRLDRCSTRGIRARAEARARMHPNIHRRVPWIELGKRPAVSLQIDVEAAAMVMDLGTESKTTPGHTKGKEHHRHLIGSCFTKRLRQSQVPVISQQRPTFEPKIVLWIFSYCILGRKPSVFNHNLTIMVLQCYFYCLFHEDFTNPRRFRRDHLQPEPCC